MLPHGWHRSGIFNLLANYPTGEAFFLVLKIAVVLYPPIAVFTIIHSYFVRKRTVLFLDNNGEKVELMNIFIPAVDDRDYPANVVPEVKRDGKI